MSARAAANAEGKIMVEAAVAPSSGRSWRRVRPRSGAIRLSVRLTGLVMMPSFQASHLNARSPEAEPAIEAAHSRHAETEEDGIGHEIGNLARDHDDLYSTRVKRHESCQRSRPLAPTALT